MSLCFRPLLRLLESAGHIGTAVRAAEEFERARDCWGDEPCAPSA